MFPKKGEMKVGDLLYGGNRVCRSGMGDVRTPGTEKRGGK